MWTQYVRLVYVLMLYIFDPSNATNYNIMKPQNTSSKILGWAVVYVATKQAKLFAGIKNETIEAFHSQNDAIIYCDGCNMGYLDELHIGYRVYPMHWIPKGIELK